MYTYGSKNTSPNPTANTMKNSAPNIPTRIPVSNAKSIIVTVRMTKSAIAGPDSAICDSKKVARYGRSVANLTSRSFQYWRFSGGKK